MSPRRSLLHLALAITACWALTDGVASADVLPESIESDMTLTAAGSPWEMHSDVFIAAGAEVTVEPDVRVIAHGDFRLTVSGTLTAMSPMGTRIVFCAVDNSATGAWKGLYFTDGAIGRFQRCTFRSAACNIMADSADVRLYNCHVRLASEDGLYAWGDGFTKAAYCRFQNNGRYGVHVQTSQPNGAIIASEFIGNGRHPVLVKASSYEMLRHDNVYQYNGVQAIGVDCGASIDIDDTDVWRDQGLPIDLAAGPEGSDLLIDAGATLRIRPGIRIYPPRRVVVRGRLLVDGTADRRVTIQPSGAGVPGEWLGVELEPGAVARLNATTIGFARDGFVVDDADLFASNVFIRNCEHDGVYAADGAHVDIAGSAIFDCGSNALHFAQANCTGKVHSTRFLRCGGYPVRAPATVVEALRYDNVYEDNARQAIGVLCGADVDITDDDAWLPQGVPFDITADLTDSDLRIGTGARLSLRPGTEVVGGGVTVTGIFVANGDPGNPVIFRSPAEVPAPGDWAGIEFIWQSAGRLVNTVVSHAEHGVSVASPGYIRIADSTFTACSGDGMRVVYHGVPLIERCRSYNNLGNGIALWGDADPLLGHDGNSANPGGNAFFSNGGYDLANYTPRAILAQSNWWGTTNQAQIAANILDAADNASYGHVNYVPFLSSLPASAPTDLSQRPPLAITSLAAHPTGSGAAIYLRLSRPADVRVTIRNIAGRRVRELTAHVDGIGVIPWDGRDLHGSATPSGRYVVEVEAFDADGLRAGALATLSIAR